MRIKTVFFIISIVLIFSLIPLPVLAAEPDPGNENIEISVPAAGVKLNYSQIVVAKGKTNNKLKAEVTPASAKNKIVTWKSENNKIAKINKSTGVITGVKNGTAKVTAQTKSGSIASCKVIVGGRPVTKVSLNKTKAAIFTNASITLSAKLSPGNSSVKGVDWQSSKPSVATVSSKGVVKGLKEGKTTITATAKDGSGKYAKCEILVQRALVQSITLNISARTIQIGQTYAVKVNKILPANAFNKDIIWESSKPGVASVTSNGEVTGISTGVTTIKAIAQDGSGKTGTCKIYVGDQVTKIELSAAKLSFTKPGETYTLDAVISPASAVCKEVSWTSSNKEVATVDSKGVVTATGKGSVTITATAADGSGIKAECAVTSKVSEADAKIYENIQKIYKKVGTDLHANYKWVVKNLSYVRRSGHPPIPKGYTREQWYAIEGFEKKKGNCYTYAAAFAQLAKGLGYDAQYIEGSVSARRGGFTPHGFVLMTIDGKKYICDPELESVGGRDLYMQPINNTKTKYKW